MLTYALGLRGWAINARLLLPPSQLLIGDRVAVFYAGIGPRQPFCRVVFQPKGD